MLFVISRSRVQLPPPAPATSSRYARNILAYRTVCSLLCKVLSLAHLAAQVVGGDGPPLQSLSLNGAASRQRRRRGLPRFQSEPLRPMVLRFTRAPIRSIWTPPAGHLDHKLEAKCLVLGHTLRRIAPCVTHNPRLSNVVVEAVVGMAVQPQLRGPSQDLRLKIRDKAGVHWGSQRTAG